jgi:serine/threonine protein kinase
MFIEGFNTRMSNNTNPGPAPKMSQFEIDRFIDRGCWKEVWHGIRKSDGTEWALKPLRRSPVAVQQSLDRQLSVDDYWKKESLGGHSIAYSNIAFSYIDIADDGEKVQVEEYIDRFLSDYVKNTPNISLEEILHISKGMSKGLDDWHNQIGRVHADFKFDNVGYSTKGVVKITDKGSSTVGEKDISNIGFILTRSPENFSGQVTKASDVWSFGSMLYAMLHPKHKYPLQDEYNNNQNFGKFISDKYQDRIAWTNLIDKKIAELDVPSYIRKLLRSTLAHEKDRISHGGELNNAVLRLEKSHYNNTPARKLRRWALTTAAVLGVGLMSYQAVDYVKDMNNKLQTEQNDAEISKRMSEVKTYYCNDRATNDGNIFAMQTLDAYNEYFGDKTTAALAYIYPEETAQAYLNSGGKKDYASLKPFVEKINDAACILTESSMKSYFDNWMFSGRSGFMKSQVENFEKLVAKYTNERDSVARVLVRNDSIQRHQWSIIGGQVGLTMEMNYNMEHPKSEIDSARKLIGK